MRRSAPRTIVLLSILAVSSGCQSTGLRFLSLIGIKKDPLVIALVAGQQATKEAGPLALVDPFGPYQQLQTALSDGLGRPVGWDLVFPIQLEGTLATGLSHMAIVSPIEYARLPQRERFPVVALTADEAGRIARPAVLVVAAGSPFQAIGDLRGKIVAFGPEGNSRTHLAALDLLARNGLKPTDLSLELLPVPGSLKHMPTSRDAALTVLNQSSQASFIDQAAWEALPEQAEKPDDPSRDRLRIIGQTVELPDRLVIASSKLDQATIDKVREVLLRVDKDKPEALRPLHLSSYQAPAPEVVEACARLTEVQTPEKPQE